MGKPADVLMEAKERSEMDENKEYESYFSDAICRTFLFRCRAKQDNFQDQTRVRYQVLSAQPLNYAVEAAKLAELIKSYHL